MAKRNRERAVEERRTRKREKKRAAAAARAEAAAGISPEGAEEPAPDAEQPAEPE